MTPLFNDIIFQFKNNPKKTAVICGSKKISYYELDKIKNQCCHLLSSNGVNHKDHLAIITGNNIEFLVIVLASIQLGITLVPLSPGLSNQALKKACTSADVKHIVGNSALLDDLNPQDFPTITGLWLSLDEKLDHTISYYELIQQFHDDFPIQENVREEDNLFLLLTSGSTGEPKPIILNQKNKYLRAKSAIELYKVTSSDNVLISTPLYHSLAIRLMLLSFISGATLVLMPRFSLANWFEIIEKESVTFTISVSSQLGQISSHKDYGKLNSLRAIVSSSAKIDELLKLDLIENLKCEFHECYGASEIAIATNLSKMDQDSKFRSVGKAIDHVDIKILKDDNSFAKAGEKGEIICKTDMLYEGYYKMPYKTNDSMFGNYFKTGDIGYLDEQGYLYYLDRKKDIIISGGINIYPKDIEEIISKLPFIKECAAFPLKDNSLGEVIALALVARENQSIDIKIVKQQCAICLSDFQQPVQFYEIDSLPRNDLGKIAKYKLQEELIHSGIQNE